MFIPVRDVNPTRSAPVVNFLLIAANVLVWLWQASLEATGAGYLEAGYSVVPVRLVLDPPGESFTILTSMFMHGGWLHLGGNMLYLYIFGDNVEDALGHARYAAFYLAGGLFAAFAQIGVDPSSQIPMVGASGAIAGVLGAYLVLHPRAPILVLNTVLPLWLLTGPFLVFPSWLAIGTWFLWNVFGGFTSLLGPAGGGVAFFAHIGGFIAGLLLVRPAMAGRSKRDARSWDGWRPPPQRPRRPEVRGSLRDPWYPPD
jgi:membrane associated rhomboid family serine protease